MALSLVVLVAALVPGCSDTSSPRSIGTDDASADRNPNVASSVTVTLDSSSVAVGSVARATVVAKNYRGAVLSGRPIKWSLSDTSLASVSEGARINTKRAGQLVVRATVDAASGQAALAIASGDQSHVSGTPAVANVAVTMDSTKLTVPHTAQASATLRDSYGNVLTGSVTWSSSNTSVATVSTSGVVTAVAAGTASIVATSGTINGTASITIAAAPVVPVLTAISVALDSAKLTVPHLGHATATLRDQNGNAMTGAVTWSSSNTSVATVSSAGVVTAVAAGTASIVGTSGSINGTASLTVAAAVVIPVVTTMSVALDSTTLTIPHTAKATATLKDQLGNVMTGTCTWSSSNMSVATVSSTGVVTSVGAGTAKIVATWSNTLNASASITVTAAAPVLATVSVTLDSTQLTVPHTAQAKAVLKDASGNVIGGSVTWSSSNTSVATVTSTGVVTAVAAGTAQIIGTSGSMNGSASIKVVAAVVPVASVSVTLAVSTINAGANTQATAVTKDASGNVLTGRAIAWSSSNPAVATVNASTGLVTGIASGNAAITATSNGKTGSATVTVAAPPPSSGGSGGTGGSSGTGTSQVKGTVADVTGAVMAGGKIDVMSGSTVVKTVAVSGSGAYTIDSLPAGTYNLVLQPSLAYSMGPAEPPARTVTVTQGGSVTQSFTVQSALYSDNFQSYGSSSQLQSQSAGPGQFWYHNGDPTYQVTGLNGSSAITLDAAAPQGAGKAVMYTFTPHTTANAVNLAGRIYPFNPPGGTTTIAYRWTDYLSANFENGGNGAVGSSREYKYFLVQLGPPSNGVPQIGLYIEGGPDPKAHRITMDVTDRVNSINTTHAIGYTLPPTWRGSWNTWVVTASGLGSSNATFTLYLNGTAIINLSGPFLPSLGSIGGGNQMLFPMLGEQVNNGPDFTQQRWFREVGVYYTRPALR